VAFACLAEAFTPTGYGLAQTIQRTVRRAIRVAVSGPVRYTAGAEQRRSVHGSFAPFRCAPDQLCRAF
jgi:hypothetical protein